MGANGTDTERPLGGLLTAGGISILLVRAVIILVGARNVLRPWVRGLAVIELAADLETFGAAIGWWRTNDRRLRSIALRLTVVAIVIHAVRVLVYVLGRMRPFKDFDVRPEARADHDERWSWREVAFAAVMSVGGLIGIGVVRRHLHQR